jgi:hypothetical protein
MRPCGKGQANVSVADIIPQIRLGNLAVIDDERMQATMRPASVHTCFVEAH